MLLVFTFLDVKFRDSIRSSSLTRMKQCNENIEDVMDGDLYKKHFDKDHFFRGTKEEQKNKELHISLQVNYGVPSPPKFELTIQHSIMQCYTCPRALQHSQTLCVVLDATTICNKLQYNILNRNTTCSHTSYNM